MAAQPSQEDFFSFVGGLNTEGGYFLTPKNSWKEGDNIIPQKDGSIQRRPSVNYEANYVFSSFGLILDAKTVLCEFEFVVSFSRPKVMFESAISIAE